MTDLHTAVIIPFPRFEPPAAEEPLERLRRAIMVLDGALAEQREAIAHWRGVMTDLQNSVGGLGTSLCSYQNALVGLDGKVGTLNEQSTQLAAWSDQLPGSSPALPD